MRLSPGQAAQALSDEIELGGLTACRVRCKALPCMGRARASHSMEQSCHPPLPAAKRAALRASAPRTGSNPSKRWNPFRPFDSYKRKKTGTSPQTCSPSFMTKLAHLKAEIMSLPDGDRAELASYILRSLPAVYQDDDGDAEALRRDAEMDADPSACMTSEEFKRAVGK